MKKPLWKIKLKVGEWLLLDLQGSLWWKSTKRPPVLLGHNIEKIADKDFYVFLWSGTIFGPLTVWMSSDREFQWERA